jgi:hypothetical protein
MVESKTVRNSSKGQRRSCIERGSIKYDNAVPAGLNRDGGV